MLTYDPTIPKSDTLSMTIADFFATLPERFIPEKAKYFKGTFHFNLQSSPYTVIIQNQRCHVQTGLVGSADYVLSAHPKVYLALVNGSITHEEAMRSGTLYMNNAEQIQQFNEMFQKKEESEDNEQNAVDWRPMHLARRPLQGPLRGIRILDLSRLLPGPLASSLLADLGAEVIKIENPFSPDETRLYPPFIGKLSAYYAALNRSKKSLGLNLRTEEGVEIFKALACTADIVIESYRPGIMKKIGIDYETIRVLKPNIIYVSLTGYGQDGKYAQEAGHDLNYIARSGILSLTGMQGGEPVIPAPQLADIAGGSYMAVIACLSALQNRMITGDGDHVDVSMLDGLLPLLSLHYAEFFANGTIPNRGELMLSGGLANYNVYTCKDGRCIALGALEPKFFQRFCQMVNRPDWMKLFAPTPDNARKLRAEMAQLFLTKTQAEWLEEGLKWDCCMTAVSTLEEATKDEHLKSRNMFISHEHPEYGKVSGINQPLKFLKTLLPEGWAAPILGADTSDILQELGLDEKDILELTQQRVIR